MSRISNYDHPIDNMVFQVLRRATIDYHRGDDKRRREVERFFHSSWYANLCALLDIDAQSFKSRVMRDAPRMED